MEAILDFSKPVDVELFDQVVQLLSAGNSLQISEAARVLSAFREKHDAFLRVGQLLESSKVPSTRFIALQVLDDAIMHRWNTFTEDQQKEIRDFVINLIFKECSSIARVRSNKMILTKMNNTLVSIAKREWPVRWPGFIQQICSSALPDQPLFENNINLLRIVGEDIFEFGEKTLTSRWVKRKKEALKGDFMLIFQLCTSALNTTDEILLKTVLDCLEKYLDWMQPSLVFNEDVLGYLAGLTVSSPLVSISALRCLTVVFSVERDEGSAGDSQAQMALHIFRIAFNNILNALPTSHSSIDGRILQMSESIMDCKDEFLNVLNQLLVSFLMNYVRKIVYDDLLLVSAHQMLLGLSYVEDKELFKSCVQYWWWLGDLLVKSNAQTPLHKKLASTLNSVRYVLIKRMAKPEEVILVVEDGEAHREHMSDVEELQLYNLMRETLVFLTNIDTNDTRQIMAGLMQKQLDRSEWSWQNCNTLSWAVGAISMALPTEQESELFVIIIRGLLELCKDMQGKDNRAVIASCIMFVVGQYPRFLRNHHSFLNTVVRKITEFMREHFDGVQEMAVDTLIKIVSHVPECFVRHDRSSPCIAQDLAERWTEVTSLLKPELIQTCFKAAGYMINEEAPELQGALLDKFLQDVNANFKNITKKAATEGPVFCRDATSMMELIHVLRVYTSIASKCGTCFIHEMNLIIWDLNGFYRTFFTTQNDLINEMGPKVMLSPEARYLRLAKKEILRIFEQFVDGTEERDFVATNCMPIILSMVLEDYRDSPPNAKEPGAMALVSACINKLGPRLSGDCAAILDHTFDTTVAMICQNTEDYPEFRINLFKLLQSLNSNCFDAFLEYASRKEDILDGMLWVIKHKDYNIMHTGLQTLDQFLQNVARSELMEAFYTAFIQRIFNEVLVVAMDSFHSAGFIYHCNILIKLFAVSDMFPQDMAILGRNNVQEFLLQILSVFPTLTPTLVTEFVNMAYSSYRNEIEFRKFFADFLIEVKVWGAEQENKLQMEEERRLREETIPGFSSLSTSGPQASPFIGL